MGFTNLWNDVDSDESSSRAALVNKERQVCGRTVLCFAMLKRLGNDIQVTQTLSKPHTHLHGVSQGSVVEKKEHSEVKSASGS